MPYTAFYQQAEQDAKLDHAIRSVIPGTVALLDLDGCLFDTRPRQVRILKAWAEREEVYTLSGLDPHHFVDRDLRRTVIAAGLSASEADRLLPGLRAAWLAEFFTDAALACDPALPGAARFVRALHARGAHIAYLTARLHDVRPGTVAALERNGFPWDARCSLSTKARFDEDDRAYKAGALEAIAKTGPIALALDNEPENVNTFRRAFPEAVVLQVCTDAHSTDPLDPGIGQIRGFLRTSDRIGNQAIPIGTGPRPGQTP